MRSSPFAHLARLPPVTTLITCLGLTLAPQPLLAAPEPSPPTLEVEISPAIPDAQDLADWIHRSSTAALSELPHPPAVPGTIRVSIFGELYDYEVTITTLRAGATSSSAATTTTWLCECTNDELLARIRTHVRIAAQALDTPPPPPEPPRPAPCPPALSLAGKIGLGSFGGGAALAAVGLSLVATGEHDLTKTRAGISVLALGATAIGTGMALLVIGGVKSLRRKRPHAAAFPLITPHAAHLGIALRF